MNMTTPSHKWVTQAGSGARWLFWTLAVSEPAAFLSGAAIPFLGGTSETLDFVAVIPAVASFSFLVGITKLVRFAGNGSHNVVRQVGKLLLGLAILNSLLRWTEVVLGFMDADTDLRILFVCSFCLHVIAPTALFSYVGLLVGRFERGWFANVSITIGVLLSVLRVVFGTVDQIALLIGLGAWAPGSSLVLFGEVAANATLGASGIAILWRFSRKFADVTRGKCSNCGYDLHKLSSDCCPECGVPAV